MNSFLHNAKNAKNDEFYTRLCDVDQELFAYRDYDPSTFKDKTILLPCDDPEWSAFTLFFGQLFNVLGLRKLISTSYAPGGRGKVFVINRNQQGKAAKMSDLSWEYLAGDGDFRSAEVRKLREEADIIVTNPPFSLFREFVEWVNPAEKQFLMIGNKNAITYKVMFPLIMSNQVWTGYRSLSNDMFFKPPAGYSPNGKPASSYRYENGELLLRSSSIWYTNMQHGRRNELRNYLTIEENLRFNSRLENTNAYKPYDNYDAIEIPRSEAVPSDYSGVMGVPISFLNWYNPSQFKILGASESEGIGFSNGLWHEDNTVKAPLLNGKILYKRLFIQKAAA